MDKAKASFITRSDISWYSSNANLYRKALAVGRDYDAILFVKQRCSVPSEIGGSYDRIIRYKSLPDLLRTSSLDWTSKYLFTGFDFPCMLAAWILKCRYGCKWTVFLWDPPSLSHRDAFLPLKWMIDIVFRFFAKRCDKLVLNIHPGLLEEIGYKPKIGQLELRLQDAWDGKDFSRVEHDDFAYDFGVLSNWSKAKGGDLMAKAMQRLLGTKCLWIGEPPKDGKCRDGVEFTGRLSQEEAFRRLRTCKRLIVPYLPVPSLKWNYPLKLFEYLELGRPIIASDNPGNAEIAKRYSDRIRLFASGSVDDFVRVVENRPLFSCILPVKGERPYLEAAMMSLKEQGMQNDLEIILQDADVEPDRGQSDAINKGMAKANGEWLFWLNSDDLLLPGALAKVKSLILESEHKGKKIDWIAGDTIYIDGDNKILDVRTDAVWRWWHSRHAPVWTGGPSSFFSRKLWKERGGLDINLKYVMDIDLWTRWAKAGHKFVSVNDYIWGFRIHNRSLTTCGKHNDEKHLEYQSIIYRYGLASYGAWRIVARMASVFDGRWIKRKKDAPLLMGRKIDDLDLSRFAAR